MLVQRPHRVEERAAAARGEGRHVDDAGGDEELPENVDARGVEIFFARYFLDLGAFGPHLARVLDARPGKVRDDTMRRPVVIPVRLRHEEVARRSQRPRVREEDSRAVVQAFEPSFLAARDL